VLTHVRLRVVRSISRPEPSQYATSKLNRTRAHVFRVGGGAAAAAIQCTQSAQHVTAPIRHREQPTAPPARRWPHPPPSLLLYWTRHICSSWVTVLTAVCLATLSCRAPVTDTCAQNINVAHSRVSTHSAADAY